VRLVPSNSDRSYDMSADGCFLIAPPALKNGRLNLAVRV
jgi:hypothetical protein